MPTQRCQTDLCAFDGVLSFFVLMAVGEGQGKKPGVERMVRSDGTQTPTSQLPFTNFTIASVTSFG